MSGTSRLAEKAHSPFLPKLVTVLREGYDGSKFRRDLIAGITVAMVALPLSMAIATASGRERTAVPAIGNNIDDEGSYPLRS